MGKQKTASAGAPRDDAALWTGVDWSVVRRNVRRLQCRIAKAVKEGRWNKVKALQRLLTRSLHARLMAVQRVTSNKGRHTPVSIVQHRVMKRIVLVVELSDHRVESFPL